MLQLPTVTCPECQKEIPHPSIIDNEVGCPNCFSLFQLDESTLETLTAEQEPLKESQDDEFQEDNTPKIKSEDPDRTATYNYSPQEAQSSFFKNALLVILTIALLALATFSWQLWNRIVQIENIQINHNNRAGNLSGQISDEIKLASQDVKKQAEMLNSLDDALGELARETKQHASKLLQSDYESQSSFQSVLRQEEKIGQLTLQLGTLEQNVYAQKHDSKVAYELSLKRRNDADVAAKPIRNRIHDLEYTKSNLISKYQRIAAPRNIPSGTSHSRAAAQLKEWNDKIAPILMQVESEINATRLAIDREQRKITDLYDDLKSPLPHVE